MNETQRPHRPWTRRAARALGVSALAGASLAALLLVLVHLPAVQRSMARVAAEKAGEALGTSIYARSIRWNLLAGTLDASDVELSGLHERLGTRFSISTLRADLSMRDLLLGRVVFDDFHVWQPGAHLALDAEGRLLLPFRAPPSTGDASAGRPDVDFRAIDVTGGTLELTDRGKDGRRVEVSGIALAGNLRVQDLSGRGTLTLARIDVSSAEHEPLRNSSLEVRWETRGMALEVTARLVSKEAGVEAGLDAEIRDLSETPRYTATLTTDGTLGPLADRLAPDLGLGGKVQVRVVASGKGTGLPTGNATARAEPLTLLGRTFERVDFEGDLAGGLLRKGALDVASGRGHLHAEASGTVLPQPRDLRFSLRADRVDLARLLVLPPGAPRVAGTLDGTVEGALARPAFEGLAATADLSLTGSHPNARNTLAPDGRARLRLAGGVLTAETVELSERETTAGLSGRYDHREGTFEGSVDVESADVGPWLALFGIAGKGQLSAHVSGGGPLSRPALDGRLRARALSIAGARFDCVDLDAKSEGSRFAVSNGSFVAYGFSAGAEAEGQLPVAGVRSPRIDLRVRGIHFRGRSLADLDAHVTLGATVEARLATADGRLSAEGVAPARGGFAAEATLERFDLAPFAAALPPHLADFHGEVTGRLEASWPRKGPLEAKIAIENGLFVVAGRRISTSVMRASLLGDTAGVEEIELLGDDGSSLRCSGRARLDGGATEAHVRLEVPELSAFARLLPPAPKGEEKGGGPDGTDPAESSSIGGSLSVDVKMAGSLERPGLTGTVRARDLVGFGLALAKLDVSLRPADEGRVAATVALAGLSRGAYRVEDVRVDAVLAGDDLSAEAAAFGGHLRMKATGSLAGEKPFDVAATLDTLDVAPFLRAAGGPADVATNASGKVLMHGTVADLRGVTVDVNLDTLEATHPKWSIRADEPVRVVLDRSRLDVRSLRLSGANLSLEASGGLPFEGKGNDRLDVTSSLDLAVLLPFVDALDRASGRATSRLGIGGSLSSPVFTGSVSLDEALLDGPDFPTPVEKVTGTVTARPGEIRTDGVSARVGGGTVVLAGTIGLAEGRPKSVDASLRARDLELEAGKDIQVRAAADLTVKGAWSSASVAGEVRLEEVTYVPTLDVSGLLKSFKERKRRPSRAPKADSTKLVPRVVFDVAVLAKDAIHVEGNIGDAELGGTLRVKGTPEAPVVLGTVSSTRGTIYFFGSTFELSRCNLSFSDPLAIDPEVDVVATTTKEEEEITIRIDGRASQAQLLLSSSKGRSQAEIVSVLLGGSGTGGGSELSAAAARMAMRGAASPILGALGAQTDLEIVPLPTTPEGEEFLFSVGKDLGGGISATYYKGVSGETTDAIEMKWRLSSRARGRFRQNQDGSLSGGFRIRRDLD